MQKDMKLMRVLECLLQQIVGARIVLKDMMQQSWNNTIILGHRVQMTRNIQSCLACSCKHYKAQQVFCTQHPALRIKQWQDIGKYLSDLPRQGQRKNTRNDICPKIKTREICVFGLLDTKESRTHDFWCFECKNKRHAMFWFCLKQSEETRNACGIDIRLYCFLICGCDHNWKHMCYCFWDQTIFVITYKAPQGPYKAF